MREKILFTVETPYRPSLPVKGLLFGVPGAKSLAVVGALRGNELQQMYVCSQLIQALQALERADRLASGCGILVIPCANQFSMNVGRRFWASDNTDINRMFPGYDKGETTQRIASRIFQVLQGYRYGVQMTSFYLPGDLIPHVRMMETGYQRTEEARAFGLPYVVLRTPQPYDTTTLNYNWQIWDTQAVSLYTRETEQVDPPSAQQAVKAILRFLYRKALLEAESEDEFASGEPSAVIPEKLLHSVRSTAGGLLLRQYHPGDWVPPDALLAQIIDPCTGQVLEQLKAGCSGRIFFAHKDQLINGHEVAFRLIPAEKN